MHFGYAYLNALARTVTREVPVARSRARGRTIWNPASSTFAARAQISDKRLPRSCSKFIELEILGELLEPALDSDKPIADNDVPEQIRVAAIGDEQFEDEIGGGGLPAESFSVLIFAARVNARSTRIAYCTATERLP